MPTYERSVVAAQVTALLRNVSVITYDTHTRHIAFYATMDGNEHPIDLATDKRTEMLSVTCSQDAVHAFILFSSGITGHPFVREHDRGDTAWRFVRHEGATPNDESVDLDTDRVIVDIVHAVNGHGNEDKTGKFIIPQSLVERSRRDTDDVFPLESPSERERNEKE